MIALMSNLSFQLLDLPNVIQPPAAALDAELK
jgi:hypothetical protein